MRKDMLGLIIGLSLLLVIPASSEAIDFDFYYLLYKYMEMGGFFMPDLEVVNLTTHNLTTLNNYNVTENVTAGGYFIGDGSKLTGVTSTAEDIWVNESGDTMTGTLNSQSVIPTSPGTYNLGSTSNEFNNLYISNRLYFGSGQAANMYESGGSFKINANAVSTDSGGWGLYAGTGVLTAVLKDMDYSNFFDGACSDNQYLTGISENGAISCSDNTELWNTTTDILAVTNNTAHWNASIVTASNIETPAFESGETSYLSIPHAAFHSLNSPESGSDEYNYGTTLYGYIAVTDTGPEVTFIAPVQLPHGATVTGYDCYDFDDAGTGTLYRAAFSDASTTSMAVSGCGGSMDTTISSATIDNQNYYYYTQVGTIDSSEQFYGAMVRYTMP
jgi:hypothetical protein